MAFVIYRMLLINYTISFSSLFYSFTILSTPEALACSSGNPSSLDKESGERYDISHEKIKFYIERC